MYKNLHKEINVQLTCAQETYNEEVSTLIVTPDMADLDNIVYACLCLYFRLNAEARTTLNFLNGSELLYMYSKPV